MGADQNVENVSSSDRDSDLTVSEEEGRTEVIIITLH